MSQSTKALIFDLDGVLVHSEPVHRRTWVSSLAACGVTLAPEDEPHLQGRTAEQVVEWLRGRGMAGDLQLERLIELKRDSYRAVMQTELEAVAGVDAFLRAQKPQIPLALVSSARLKLIGQIMLQFNWRNIFSALIAADHVANVKPHPEPYQRAAERLRIKPVECLVFEDSAVGIEAARTAGARVCGVASTLDAAGLKAAGAQWVIKDFSDTATIARAMTGESSRGPLHWIKQRIGGG